jgi:small multidrug resistance pump
VSWLWLAVAIASELGATLSLRASHGLRRRAWLAPVALGYALAFAFLALALDEGMKVGVAYGVWVAVGVALVTLLTRAIWKEPLTTRMLLGIGLILAGVVLVELG